METPWNLIRSLFRLLLCGGPFILLALIAGIVAFFLYDSRKKQANRLHAVMTGLAGISLPELNEVIGLGANPTNAFTQIIVDIARQLQELANGNASPLQRRTLHRPVQALEVYRQQATFGQLNDILLTNLREGHLREIGSLIAVTSGLINAAEKGEAETVRQSLGQAVPLLSQVHRQHVAFQQELAKAGVQFPLPQPVTNLALTTEQIAKYAVFVTVTQERLRRCAGGIGYYSSVQEAISWMSRGMMPEWRVELFNTGSNNPQIALYALTGTGYVLVFQGSVASYEEDFPVEAMTKHFNQSQIYKVAETALRFREQIVSSNEFDDFDDPYADDLTAVEEELQEHVATGLSSAWSDITASFRETDTGGLSSEEANFLAKYVVFSRMLQLVRSGIVNTSLAVLQNWAIYWTSPEFFVLDDSRDPGVVVLAENPKNKDQYPDFIREKYSLYPLFRSDTRYFELNTPMAEHFKALQPTQLDLVLELASRLVELLNPYSAKLLKVNQRQTLSEILPNSELRLALPPRNIGSRGITMLDMGLATQWQAVQLSKLVLCTFLSQAIMRKAVEIPGLSSDASSCAQWGAQWLRPHWEMVVPKQDGYQYVVDPAITLYPINELTRGHETAYFVGPFLKFANEFPSAIENEIQRLDPNAAIPNAVEWAILHYGKAGNFSMDQDFENLTGLVAIEPEDPFLAQKVGFNDHALVTMLNKGGLATHSW